MKLISTRSNENLANLISMKLKIPLCKCTTSDFLNSEIRIELGESVRGQDIYIVGSGSSFKNKSINDNIMEIYLIASGCQRSQAKSITIIIPCFPYARSDKKDHRGPISAQAICSMFSVGGVTRIISVDLHSGQIVGFTNNSTAFDNIYSIKILSNYIKDTFYNYTSTLTLSQKFILISPDCGGIKRVEAYSKLLKIKSMFMHKERDLTKMNEVSNMVLIGEKELIKNKNIIIIDDMIDTARTMITACNLLKSEYECNDIYLMATHGVFSSDSLNLINSNDTIKNVIVTNSIDQTENVKKCNKLIVIDLSELLSNVILAIENNESLSELF
jgi:ribose-phosphate pyrophosphokinase